MTIEWQRPEQIDTQDFRCWICDRDVSSNVGLEGVEERFEMGYNVRNPYYVAICPRCGAPTFVVRDSQVPEPPAGEPVGDLPDDVAGLYAEARLAMTNGAPTAAVLLGRKLLMHVTVSRGAAGNQGFREYVDYLVGNGVVTVGMEQWVDEIRELGNDANHEIVLANREAANELMMFVAMLLQVVYEYPAKAARSIAARQARAEGGE